MSAGLAAHGMEKAIRNNMRGAWKQKAVVVVVVAVVVVVVVQWWMVGNVKAGGTKGIEELTGSFTCL